MTAILAEKKVPVLGVRHLQATLMFLCTAVTYFIRVNTSITVVAMTDKNTTNPDFEEFNWIESERNNILGAFYWGYILTQIPCGWIAQHYGAKFLLLTSLSSSSIISLITPISVHYGGWMTFCAIRMLQGMVQGAVFPCFHVFFSKWAPFNERNRLVAFGNCGAEFGTALAFCLSGLIAASPLGWPGIYYISGAIGLIWAIVWLCFGANTPADSKIISLGERKFIEDSINQFSKPNLKRLPIPWLSIFTSVPYWALFITRMCQAWGFNILLTQIPTYMNKILKMDIKSNAIYSSIPYIFMLTMTFLLILVADALSAKKIRLCVIRKLINTIAFWIPAVCIMCLAFIGNENIPLVIVLLGVTIGSNGGSGLGSSLNHLDLAPNFVGILMALTNSASTGVAIIQPIIQSEIITNDKDQSQWKIMFVITSIIYFVGNLVYIIFGDTNAQLWNNQPDEEEYVEKQEKIKL